eukprot:8433928-Pyramimonas_sp.AAC.1
MARPTVAPTPTFVRALRRWSTMLSQTPTAMRHWLLPRQRRLPPPQSVKVLLPWRLRRILVSPQLRPTSLPLSR